MFDKYIKVTKDNWSKIELLFEKKELIISELKNIINSQNIELQSLRKYKSQDDLLFSYEQSLSKLKNENKKLQDKLNKSNTMLFAADKKIKTAISLEKLYLEKINIKKCQDYEIKGDDLINFYA